MKETIFAFSLALAMTVPVSAQNDADTLKPIVFHQGQTPVGIDNYGSGFYYYNGKKVYTLRNYVAATGSEIYGLKVNPSGSSYAIIDKRKGKGIVKVFDLWKAQDELRRSHDIEPSAICYSADARKLYVASPDNKIHMLDAASLKESSSFSSTVVPTKLTASPNGYFIVASAGHTVEVVNAETQTARTTLNVSADVKDVAFSADSKLMAVLTADGHCDVYDTKSFTVSHHYEAMGTAESCYFHPENKYLAVVTGDKRVAIINILNEKDRVYVDADEPGVDYVKFVKDASNKYYLVYNTDNSIVFAPMFSLSPNRMQMLTEELNSRMDEWMKRMDGESLEDYNKRVNADTRMAQMKLFETEIATRMAGNTLAMSNVSLGGYNTEMSMLTLDFDNMPSIYLSVPKDQLGYFSSPSDLEFNNSRYFINDQDEFELVYTEVTNKRNGKKYIFDNTERKSLAFLESDDNFVPFDQLQISKMEEMKLEELKDNIITDAIAKNIISDHTKIGVNTKVVSDVDAAGNRISNYQVNVSYTVDKEYSAKDDYGLGRYKIEESNAAKSMLAVIKQAFEGDLAKYVVPGKKLKVLITGQADAVPFTRAMAYDGTYGEFVSEPTYQNGELSNITVTKASGISTNEQLAFLRAQGVKDYMVKNIPSFSKMDTTYDTNTEVSTEKGSQYRRINVQLTFVNAF